ncbi:MAG: peptidase M61 [Balneolaceae bacterium]|nr:peptidase M61 [Balneolaceae bacterium]
MIRLYATLLLLPFLLAGCSGSSENTTVTYDVRFPNAVHNEAEITLTLENLSGPTVRFTMSRTSPGRYALHEFAKNVYRVHAVDGEGDTLDIHRPDLHNWIVSGHDGTVRFTYTLFARHADGTYSGVNEQHAHLNIPATFAWAGSLEERPVRVNFHPPEGSDWDVATQLRPEGGYSFSAPDLDYFLDSPTELSAQQVESWTVSSDTASYEIRLAVHHNGTSEEVARYADMARKVVDEQIAVFGEPAPFDYGSYTFIADYLPYVYGDGMEHRNSTVLTSGRALAGDGALGNLGTLSHEFFHSWNVERIRPASLEPFDFMEANVTGTLWFAEGFTSYYDDLTIRRAGLYDDARYARGIGNLLSGVINAPGRRYYTPVQMSMQAPFVDAATSVDAQNKDNTFVSYYSWGAAIGLGLDLSLRSQFEDLTLDDYMREVWRRYGVTEQPYQIADLRETLAEVTGDSAFAADYFHRYIYGRGVPDYERLLAKAGFLLIRSNPGAAVLQFGGNKIDFEAGEAVISDNTLVGSPLYEAGLDEGDRLLSLGGRAISDAQVLNRLLASRAPGDTLQVRWTSLGEEYSGELVLAEDPSLEVVPYEDAGRELTEAMRAFRSSWLGSRAGNGGG